MAFRGISHIEKMLIVIFPGQIFTESSTASSFCSQFALQGSGVQGVSAVDNFLRTHTE